MQNTRVPPQGLCIFDSRSEQAGTRFTCEVSQLPARLPLRSESNLLISLEQVSEEVVQP